MRVYNIQLSQGVIYERSNVSSEKQVPMRTMKLLRERSKVLADGSSQYTKKQVENRGGSRLKSDRIVCRLRFLKAQWRVKKWMIYPKD